MHQKLYQADNVTAINMATYIPELIQHLSETFDHRHQVRFDLQIPSVEVDVVQAIPLGLIINEAITNSLKYAFLNRHNNQISVVLQEIECNRFNLQIYDNGKGLPERFDPEKNMGLGLKLMKGMTEDINGKFCISSDKGTRISISFIGNTLLPRKGTGTSHFDLSFLNTTNGKICYPCLGLIKALIDDLYKLCNHLSLALLSIKK